MGRKRRDVIRCDVGLVWVGLGLDWLGLELIWYELELEPSWTGIYIGIADFI